jgi:hypothetical protein
VQRIQAHPAVPEQQNSQPVLPLLDLAGEEQERFEHPLIMLVGLPFPKMGQLQWREEVKSLKEEKVQKILGKLETRKRVPKILRLMPVSVPDGFPWGTSWGTLPSSFFVILETQNNKKPKDPGSPIIFKREKSALQHTPTWTSCLQMFSWWT